MLTTALLGALAAAGPAAARNIYVANSTDGTVSVISDVTNTVIATPAVGAVPFGLAITPDGRSVYVANRGGNSVSKIDTSTNVASAPIALLTVASDASEVAISPDGSSVYVSENAVAVNKVAVINTATSAVTEFNVGTGPRGLAVSPDGGRLYVAQSGANSVRIVSTADNSEIATVPNVGTNPIALSITPDGSKLYVSNTGDDTVTVINTTTLAKTTLTGSFQFNPAGSAITPDGATAYVTRSSALGSGATAIRTADNSIASIFSVGTDPRPEFDAVNPAGTRLYTANLNTNNVSVIDTATNTAASPQATVGNLPRGIAVVPDQAPTASFTTETAGACTDTKFNGSASTDADGSVASYAWDFGDGKTETTTTATVNHAYAKGGTYTAKLTATDNEGTSTDKVYTGQTMLRNGSSAAQKSQSVTIPDAAAPSVTVKKPQKKKRYKRRTFRRLSGTVSDPCGVDKVNYALALSRGGKCRYLGNTGKLGRKRRSCKKPIFRKAKLSGEKWSKTLGHRLPAGSYALSVNATNKADVKSKTKKVRFRLR